MSLTSYIKTNITEMRINMDKYINAPISDEDARSLKSGDYVYITGTIYTARDAAHKSPKVRSRKVPGVLPRTSLPCKA